MSSDVRLVAPAKLTWSLRVTGRRDDGYHLLEAEMVSLDLADEIVVGDGDGIEVVDPDGVAPGCPADDSNLARRALLGRRAHLRIIKAIPDGAGLGGGSADAAAVLRWVGRPDAAVGLGADVAFCVLGGRARVTGIGEIVEPLVHLDRTVTLVTPPAAVATAAVYRAWDELGGPTGDHDNDLEPAAVVVEPVLAAWRDAIAARCGVRPRLAGSGSTWWVEGDHGAALRGLEVADRPARMVRVARTTSR